VATTTNVEIDTQLLERLRARHPGKTDRELVEELATIELGFATLHDVQKRFALSEAEATELGVRAVHESRRA
jgi:hypothetical protein